MLTEFRGEASTGLSWDSGKSTQWLPSYPVLPATEHELYTVSFKDMTLTNKTQSLFSDDPAPRVEHGPDVAEAAVIKPLPERWPFTNPHFSVEIPVPSSLSTLGAHSVRLELSTIVSAGITDWPGEKVPQAQSYDPDSRVWDFTVDVGAIAHYVVSATLRRRVIGDRTARFSALLFLRLFDAFPDSRIILNFRLGCRSISPSQGTYTHTVMTHYVISAYEYFRHRSVSTPGYGDWCLVDDESSDFESSGDLLCGEDLMAEQSDSLITVNLPDNHRE